MLNQKGFTLLEMLTAMAVTTIVGAAGYTFFNRSFDFTMVHSKKNEMQREIRIAADMIVRDIRGAGFGVINPLDKENNFDAAAGFTMLTSNNNFDPDPDGVANQLDRIAISGAFQLVGRLSAAAAQGANTLVVTPLAGTNPTAPSINGQIVTINGFFTAAVTNVAGPNAAGDYTLTLATTLDRTYTTLNDVSVVQNIVYNVVPAGPGLDLVRTVGAGASSVIASGIEDFQIAYLLNDGTVANTLVGAVASVRAVRVSILARNANPDGAATISTRPVLEDHAAGAAADNFHRRMITRVVEIRNSAT
ncbi:MAG: prepilin-type N-terminal cleavage/methylation domain-containing protein [Nitrospiria bacterium]